MRHSIHTQHTKSSHRLTSLSVSSGDLLVAINKLLNESHGVNGAPASNNVIPRKYTHSYGLLILFDSVYGVLELFLPVRNIHQILSTPSTPFPLYCPVTCQPYFPSTATPSYPFYINIALLLASITLLLSPVPFCD